MDDSGERRLAVIIEDDPDIRGLLETVLSQAGFETVSAGNGIDGVAAVRQFDPVVTTLDVSLPGIDGFEAAKRIRAFSNTYIVMLTARDEEIDDLHKRVRRLADRVHELETRESVNSLVQNDVGGVTPGAIVLRRLS